MIIRFAILTTYLATFSATFAEVKGIRRGAEDGIPFFENEIRPILHEFCLECHSSETKGGLRLDSRIGIEAGGDSGAAIVKGDPKASLLIEAIRYGNRDLQMPPKNPLPEDKIAKLEKWITMGAPDPRNLSLIHI